MVITFSLIYFSKSSFKENGFSREGSKFALDIGFTGWLVWVIPITALLFLQINYNDLLGSLIILGFVLLAIFLILLITKNTKKEEVESNKQKTLLNLILLTFLLLLPIFIGLYLQKSTNTVFKIVSTVIWQFVFSGFGEEFRYRGYYQPRINREYGTPCKILEVNFGLALFVSAALFGLSHVFNPFSPFEGIFDLSWGWGIWTLVLGSFSEYLRKKHRILSLQG